MEPSLLSHTVRMPFDPTDFANSIKRKINMVSGYADVLFSAVFHAKFSVREVAAEMNELR